MTHNSSSIVQLVAAVWLLAALAGCHSNHTGQAASCECYPGCYGTPLCYGYHSTCWRPWPEECPNCPPFTLSVTPAESVLPAPPLPEVPGATRPMPMPPMPMPEASPPQPMLQPATPPAAPMPAAPRENGSAAHFSDEEPRSAADDGMLRRRWVEGGFVSRPLNR